MKKCMFLFATDRSGHHAFLHWLCHQVRPSMYFNSCHTEDGKILILKNGMFFPHGNASCRQGGKDAVNEPNGHLDTIKFLAFNAPLELTVKKGDRKPNKVVHESFYLTHRDYTIENTIYTVLLRDIYNLLASQLQTWGGKYPKHVKTTTREWTENVKVALGDIEVPEDIRFLDVCYNGWFLHKHYRKWIAEQFELEFNDVKITESPSAFTGTSHFGKTKNAQEMKVLERWKMIKKPNDVFKHVTDEMHELNERYFGFSIRDGEKICVDT